MKVTLDVFSGRPNPSWALSPRDAASLLDRFADRPLPPAHQVEPALGYRGYVVAAEHASELGRAGLPAAFRVGPAVPRSVSAEGSVAARAPQPDDDALWLLNTAGRAVDDDLGAYIEAAIRSPRSPRAPTTAGRAEGPHDVTLSANCVIRNAPFIPAFWNQLAVMPYNNCYNYAMNYRSNSFAQPGRISGLLLGRMTRGDVTAAAGRDGCVRNCSGVAKQVALVVWPNVDFHWYRNHTDGFWGHKIGSAPATNLDNANRVITDAVTPEFCAREPYTEFGGFLHPPLWIPVL